MQRERIKKMRKYFKAKQSFSLNKKDQRLAKTFLISATKLTHDEIEKEMKQNSGIRSLVLEARKILPGEDEKIAQKIFGLSPLI